jgi:hypothetical protein
MPYQSPPAVPDAQRSWIRLYANEQSATLRRVYDGLGKLGLGGGHPTRIGVYVALQAIEMLRGGHGGSGGVWPLYPAKRAVLTPEQVEYLRGVAGRVQRELEIVGRYFDAAGCPDPAIPASVRTLAGAAHAVWVHLHYFENGVSSGRVPGHPIPCAAEELWCGADI